MEKTIVIITLFSAGTVRLDDESVARVLDGDYPVRVKSKILATTREIASASDTECVAGFLPVVKESRFHGITYKEDATQDHYADLALYLMPEAPCSIVSDLLTRGRDGVLACRGDLVRGNGVIVIGDRCGDWSEVVSCLEGAGATSVRCISIISQND